MQFTAQELTEKLLRALDKDNNVVDMPAVLEILSSLEMLQVTKELLEQTKLGKYVNEMRKKTSNKDLAKRAKNLVRKWQAAVMPPAAQTTPQFNGDKLGRHGLPTHLLSTGSKPASPASRPDTPSSIASSASPNLPSNRLSPKTGFRPVTPGLSKSTVVQNHSSYVQNHSSKVHSSNNTNNSASTAKRLSPCQETRNGHSASLNNHTQATPNFNDYKASISKTDVANKRKRRDGMSDCETPIKKSLTEASGLKNLELESKNVSVMNGVITSTPKQRDNHNSRSQALLGGSIKKGASSDNLKTYSDRKKAKLNLNTSLERTASNSSFCSDRSEATHGSRTPIIKTPRVKTTAQLVADLATSGGFNAKDSVAVRKIALNQIDKEKDDDMPVVPAGARPRPRRKPKTIAPPQTTDKSLHETKNEMVHKFLASAMPPHTPDYDLGNSSSSLVQNLSTPSVEGESPNSVSITGRPRESSSFSHGDASGYSSNLSSTKDEATSKLLKIVRSESDQNVINTDTKREPVKFSLGDNESIQTVNNSISDDPWSLLPPLDRDSIDWSSLSYTPAERVEVNEETLEQLHTQHWPGVNGFQDSWHNWNDLTRTYSMPSYNGDILHILPYVVLDDINEEILPEAPP